MSISFGICPTDWRTGRSEPWSASKPTDVKTLCGKVLQLDDFQAVRPPWKNLDRAHIDPDRLKVSVLVEDEDDTLDAPCLFPYSRPRHKPRGNDRLLCAGLVGHSCANWDPVPDLSGNPYRERNGLTRRLTISRRGTPQFSLLANIQGERSPFPVEIQTRSNDNVKYLERIQMRAR